MSETASAPGFYGKLPLRGDFIGRRLGRRFIDAWDAWLQESLHEAKERLGPGWLDIYLTSPIWRFVLAPDACGPAAVAGVMIPSVDQVGRYFPLMVGAEIPGGADPVMLLGAGIPWYEALASLALTALDPAFTLERFEAPIPSPPAGSRRLSGSGGGMVHVAGDPTTALSDVARAALDATPRAGTVWWTDGSERIAPCLLVCDALPPPDRFPALLDGSWQASGWSVSEPDVAAEPGSSWPLDFEV